MAKENDSEKESELEKVKDSIEARVEQYEKSLENSTSPVGEFITQADAEEDFDKLSELLGQSLSDRLKAVADKRGMKPVKLAQIVIAQYLDSLEKAEPAK